MKSYSVKINPADSLTASNNYQQDFLYLKTLADEVVPLQDRYFPPDKRAALEQEILQQLGDPGCTHETFVLSLDRYLAGFNCEHAAVVENPRPIRFTGLYPFRIHYVSNDLYVTDIAREYDRSLIGQRITAINDQPVAEVEEKLSGLVSEENIWTKRAALESPPFHYTRPETYRRIGLTDSVSNSVTLQFADHPPVSIAPKWKEKIQWHGTSRPPHPITAGVPHQYDCQIFSEQRFAYLQFNACFDKLAILEGLNMVKPWVRPLIRAWLGIQFRRKKASGVLEGIYDPERPVFKDYLAAAIGEINGRGITNLIIDLRRNSGGETELCNQLLYHLTRRDDLRNSKEFIYNVEALAHYDPDGAREVRELYLRQFGAEPPSGQLLATPEISVFAAITNSASGFYVTPDRAVFNGNIIVLANQRTGSAASLLTALIQDNRFGTVVGTATGNNPTGPTGMTPFTLPRSGIMVSLPIEYDERAVPSNGEMLRPEYWVENSMADIQTGRDAAFEKALELLGVDDERSGPLADDDIESAVNYMKNLKENGQQPGWSKSDTGKAYLKAHSYFGPRTLTLSIRKDGDSSSYEYTVTRRAEDSWELQKARRLDRKGQTKEEYPVP